MDKEIYKRRGVAIGMRGSGYPPFRQKGMIVPSETRN